jgi:hypothetical protein
MKYGSLLNLEEAMDIVATTRGECGATVNDRNALKDDILWGVKAIAGEIDRTQRQTFHLLETNQLPAKKVGGRWTSRRSALQQRFDPDSAKSA